MTNLVERGDVMSLFIEKVEYSIVNADALCLESGIGSEMGLTSETILSFSLLFTGKKTEKVYVDLETQEFAFNPSDLSLSDTLYEFGELCISLLNRYRTPDLFLSEIDFLIKLGHFDIKVDI